MAAADHLKIPECLDQRGVMSYINDALHKAQKEKGSPYASYGGVVSAEGKKPGTRRTRVLAIGLIAVFFFAAGLIAWLTWPAIRKTPGAMTIVQSPGVSTARPKQNTPFADARKMPTHRPSASAEVAAPLSTKIEKTPSAGKTLTDEVKEEKQNAVIPDNNIKQEASPQPALADLESLYKQALQKQREGKLKEAKELYKEVIKKEPRHIQALNNLGVVYLKLKRYKWAIIRFNDALDIQHNYVDAYYNLACLYAQKNDTKQSLFYLKNAIDFNPDVRQWAARDNDFKNLANLPAFNKILQARDK
jgi:tetratricopeptide (TPR) repeat protein